jgi:hypothetical protein
VGNGGSGFVVVDDWKGKAEGRDSDGDGARPYLP